MSSLVVMFCSVVTSKEVKKYTIEQFYKNSNIWGGSFSWDESRLLVTSNETGIYNVFALPVDGSQRQQLTHSTEESFFAISYLPKDKGFLYGADKGGDENDHIYWVDNQNNTSDITPFDSSKSHFFAWSRDEKSFFFISNKRNARFFDLYEKSLETMTAPNECTLLYQNDEGFDVGAISHSKRYLALTKSHTTSNNDLYLYDLQTNEKKHISQHTGDAEYNPQFFDVANAHLYFLSNEGSEYMYLAKYHLATGKKELVFQTDWDIWYAYDSYNEKYRVIGVNEDAKTSIHMINTKTNAKVALPVIEGASISSVSISKSENLVRLTVSTSASPNNIYVYDLVAKRLKKLTNALNPEINPDDLVEGRMVRYKSFDGREIPSVYYQPHSASSANQVPALIWVHGGPGGQSRLDYFALIQYLVNHDFAILAVNNRGSSGYGKTFYKLDDKNHGDKDLKDCIWGKQHLSSTSVVDTSRIGIIGGSYGGYMVMAALTFAPEAFDVGVNIFGVTNWLRTLKSIPPYWESFREALYAELGDPFSSDSTRLYNISPLFHAQRVTKPLIVLQGANDPRVLQVESDEIVAAVRSNGVPVEYVLFDDEGHGFVKKENEIKGYGKVKEFLDIYLKDRRESGVSKK
jgi:dipeptidyl aminopeptidase/acylaminoacyl peptidase